MKKFFMATVIVALFGGILLSSCTKKSDYLIGKWVIIKAEYASKTYDFGVEEEELVIVCNADGTASASGLGNGTWKYEKNQITLTSNSYGMSLTYTVKELTSSTLIVEGQDIIYGQGTGKFTFTKVK